MCPSPNVAVNHADPLIFESDVLKPRQSHN